MHVPLLFLALLVAALAGISPFGALLHIVNGMLLGVALVVVCLFALYLMAN